MPKVRLTDPDQGMFVDLDVGPGIIDQFYELCDRRNVDPGIMFETMLRSFDRKPVMYNQYDRIDFGKYNGMIIEDVMRSDPRYMKWLVSTSTWFKLTGSALEILQNVEV